MKFVVIGWEGCLASSFVGLVDMLMLARTAIQAQQGGQAPFDVVTVSRHGRSVLGGRGQGLKIDTSLAEVGACDALFVPGFSPGDRLQAPELRGLEVEAAWIHQQHAYGATAYASCCGAYLLGHARLLDDRRCTTAWWLHDELKRRHPRAQPQWGRALVEDRGVVTAGSPLSWSALALHAVRSRCGPKAARVAEGFAAAEGGGKGEPSYLPTPQLAGADAFVLQAERAVRHARGMRIGARELAARLAVSPRTLHRRLAAVTGESVKQFIDRVRIDIARAALELDDARIKQVAFDAGFEDETSFRRLFKRVAGTTPGAYREAMRGAQSPA